MNPTSLSVASIILVICTLGTILMYALSLRDRKNGSRMALTDLRRLEEARKLIESVSAHGRQVAPALAEIKNIEESIREKVA